MRPLEVMETRIAALGKLGLEKRRIGSRAHFGRNMEYYTGFVFELWSRDIRRRGADRGRRRYDTLLKMLGAQRDIPAVGCAIRTERVLAARRVTGSAQMSGQALILALPSKGRCRSR